MKVWVLMGLREEERIERKGPWFLRWIHYIRVTPGTGPILHAFDSGEALKVRMEALQKMDLWYGFAWQEVEVLSLSDLKEYKGPEPGANP